MSENELAAQQPKEEKPDSAPDQTELVAQAKPQQRPITVESATNSGEITFKIQILTSSSPLTKNDKRLKGLKDVDYYKEKGL